MYASSLPFVSRVNHTVFILSCNVIGRRENKSHYFLEMTLRLRFADVIFPRTERSNNQKYDSDKNLKKSLSLGAFDQILKKLFMFKV